MDVATNNRIIQLLINESPILQDMITHGTLTAEAVVGQYYMGKFKELEAVHQRALRKRLIKSTGQSQWVTTVYVDDPKAGKVRKDLTASSEKELKVKLLDFYGLNIDNKITMKKAYDAYARKHAAEVSSDNSRIRAEQIYKKYLAGTDIMEEPVCMVKKPRLETFCNQLIKEKSVTADAWQNLKAVLNGIFTAAMDAEEITVNPLPLIRLTAKFAQPRKKPSSDLYYSAEELEDLRTWMMAEYEKTQNIACLAVLFQVVTGMRVGEIGALRWSDILPDEISIERELICNKRQNTYYIVQHTKGYDKRFIPRHPLVTVYLGMIKKRTFISSELVFIQPDGSFVTTRAINNILEKYAKYTGRPVKRSHSLRRTYATLLYLAGESEENIKEALGHSDISTTRRYICAKRNATQSADLLAKAL